MAATFGIVWRRHWLASSQHWKCCISKQMSHIWCVEQFCFGAWVALFWRAFLSENRGEMRRGGIGTYYVIVLTTQDNRREQVWTWIDLTVVSFPSRVLLSCVDLASWHLWTVALVTIVRIFLWILWERVKRWRRRIVNTKINHHTSHNSQRKPGEWHGNELRMHLSRFDTCGPIVDS